MGQPQEQPQEQQEEQAMQLSAHFTLADLTRSAVAARRGIDNGAPLDAIERLKPLCQAVLEPLRARFGAVQVTSGYRCPALNAAIGGKPGSQHLRGEAADLVVPGVATAAVARWILATLPHDQVILECYRAGDPASGWVHVSYVAPPGVNRHEALTFDGRSYRAGIWD